MKQVAHGASLIWLNALQDPEMLREVSDPALTMWSEPKHPMFTNMARKLEDLGPVQVRQCGHAAAIPDVYMIHHDAMVPKRTRLLLLCSTYLQLH